MSSLNRITPAAVNNTLEISPALANLNFDFSLWKVEAPKEFDGVRSVLSAYRRDEAENGMPHITARKLGALFETIIPSTPNLTRAYGQRASEISQASSVIPQTRSKFGVFSGQVGPDATSIWAAATSSQAAIAVHLLACLLARMWDGPEATSIWTEIVQRRKEIVHTEMNQRNIIEIASLEAARQNVTRAQIAEWDASARSWLRTADAVKAREHKQLMLIIDNIQSPVNRMSDTYESVITAWKNSMTQMEGLIEGISQQAVSGDILLALSAWHLFPDMMIVNPSRAQVSQHDQIFTSGGILTIGLEQPDQQRTGVYWSLPLARLRHYGAPVVSSCSISSTGLTEAKAMMSGITKFSWLSLLLSAAKYYEGATGNEKLVAKKLVSLDRRHGPSFLGLPKAPLFGLLRNGGLVSIVQTEDDRIDLLREVAEGICKESSLQPHEVFIRYKHSYSRSSKDVFEYATAIPWKRSSTKRRYNGAQHASEAHRRWLYTGDKDLQSERSSDWRYEERLDQQYGFQSRGFIPKEFFHWHSTRRTMLHEWQHSDRVYFDASETKWILQEFNRRAMVYANRGEDIVARDCENVEDFAPHNMGIFWDGMGVFHSKTPWYKCVYGDINTAAIFLLEQKEAFIGLVRTDEVESQNMYSLFESNKIDSTAVVKQLDLVFQTANVDADPHMQSAKAVSTAAMIYKDFPNATVDVRVIQCKLYQAKWVKYAVLFGHGPEHVIRTARGIPRCLIPYNLTQASIFACITMFESGHYDAEPTELDNVMALSSGDSIYAAAALLSDPSTKPSFEVKRVTGNIGRPGIAFLIPPVAPLIKNVTINEWPQIGQNEFDWTLRDCFKSTSLHLKFTGASTPVNLGFSGGQDVDVYMLETLVSVHDGGRWIADLNILQTFNSNRLEPMLLCPSQNQHEQEEIPECQMISIDNWLELIETPKDEDFCLVQAHKNWEARLAASSISVAMGHHTLVAPEKLCWQCLRKRVMHLPRNLRPVVAII